MTMTETDQPQFSIAELGAKFGALLAQALGEIITLEKKMQAKQMQIQAMTKNEAQLVDHIQDLEDDLGLLKSENLELREITEAQRIQTEAFTGQMKEPAPLSPALAEIAKSGSAIIAAENKEAAPV